MLEFENLSDFVAKLDAELLRVEAEVTNVFRGYCVAVYHRILLETPQWSGNAVSNWNFSVGVPDYTVDNTLLDETEGGSSLYQGLLRHVEGASKGDMSAIQVSTDRNLNRDVEVTLLAPVFISNACEDLSGDTYIMKLEENPNLFLRPENQPGHMVEYTVAEARMMMLDEVSSTPFSVLRIGSVLEGGRLMGV